MDRKRCSKCRNPIRGAGVARAEGEETTWFHADCWVEVCGSEQAEYERRIQESGLAALLDPYICLHSARPHPVAAAGSSR